jgi:signal transduction histidine kinase
VLLVETLRSSTLKLALLYIGLFGAAIIGLFGYVYWSTVSYVRTNLEQEIAREHGLLRNAYKHGGRSELIAAMNWRITGPGDGSWSYLLVDNTFVRIAGDLSRWPAALGDSSGRSVFASLEHAGADLRTEYQTLPDGSHLLVGQLDTSNGFVETIATGLVGAVGLMILLAAVAGISTSRRSVARIEAINMTSREIMRSGLGQRIPRRGTGDEWDGLAKNLNAMLDRIGELVEWNRQVSDNVAHDLRTPLTRVRGRLEQAYNQPFDPARYRTLLGNTIAELDDILRIFSSLLRISRIEAQAQRAAFHRLDLSELAREVVELFEPTAEERGTTLRMDDAEPVAIMGDRSLLFDALSNLVDNALKHGGSGRTVSVEVRGMKAAGAVLVVADDGPGIPPEEWKNVVKRFYRLERSRSTPGSGLGLSLVEAVAHLHEARIEFIDNRPGLNVELHFPSRASTRAFVTDTSSVA